MDEKLSDVPGEASLFSLVRFGPGAITILSFITIMAILFYVLGQRTFALLLSGLAVLFFAVKSMERIQLPRTEEKKLIGEMCLVVKAVRRGQQGVVRVLRHDGTMESELWSAESEDEVEEGTKARVIGMRSIVLLIVSSTAEMNGGHEEKVGAR